MVKIGRIMSTNTSLYLNEIGNFSPNLFGWKRYVFTFSAIVTTGLAYLVQRAVYRSLKLIGPRPINEMIMPCQVIIITTK